MKNNDARYPQRTTGWKFDLPGPNEPPTIEPYPLVLPNPPNHVDDIYLDLSCSTLSARGISAWIAILFIPMIAFLVSLWVMVTGSEGPTSNVSFNIAMLGLFGVTAWIGTYFWRMDVEAPVDEPIRFNRLRRKVYVYRFYHDGKRPFSGTAWGIKPRVYEWDDLHAEACSVYGPMGTGGLLETVSIAVFCPGTQEVIDRFHFAHGIQQGEMYWAMAQLFMQQGKQALPKFDRPPRDWNNEPHTFNLARRFAPKVVWPEAMDIESRTAP